MIKWPVVVPWPTAVQWCRGVGEGTGGRVGKGDNDVGIGKGAVVWWSDSREMGKIRRIKWINHVKLFLKIF